MGIGVVKEGKSPKTSAQLYKCLDEAASVAQHQDGPKLSNRFVRTKVEKII